MKTMLILPALLAVAVVGVPAAPAQAGCGACGAAPHVHDLVDTAVEAGSFETLVKAVEAAGLTSTLKTGGPFTIFAPTDEAFAALPPDTLNALLADREALTQVLTYHVVSGKVPASEAVNLDWADTVQGQSLRLEAAGEGTLRVDGATVIAADVEASNGLIHVIDRVLLPRPNLVETAKGAGSFGTLVTAVKAADLVETLSKQGPFTVFAPTDAAFAALPEGTIPALLEDKPRLTGILTYHVIRGRVLAQDIEEGTIRVPTLEGRSLEITRSRDGSVTIDGVRVVQTDVLAGNGVIHVIDGVLLPR